MLKFEAAEGVDGMPPMTRKPSSTPPSNGDGLSEDARQDLRCLLDVLERFRQLRPTMPVSTVCLLLRVASEEGLTVGEYSRKSGLAQTVASRILLDLSDRPFRSGDEGLGFLARRYSPHSLREINYSLSQKGKYFLNLIVDSLNLRKR